MELRLQRYTETLAPFSQVDNKDEFNLFVLNVDNDGQGHKFLTVVSTKEPINMYLPLNAVWINRTYSNKYYMLPLKLKGFPDLHPQANLGSRSVITDGDFVYKWVFVRDYDDLWSEQQVYNNTGPKGPIGDKGPTGDPGPTATVDYPAIITEALLRTHQVLGY